MTARPLPHNASYDLAVYKRFEPEVFKALTPHAPASTRIVLEWPSLLVPRRDCHEAACQARRSQSRSCWPRPAALLLAAGLVSACSSSGGTTRLCHGGSGQRRAISGLLGRYASAHQLFPRCLLLRQRDGGSGYGISLREGIACRSSVPPGKDPNRNATGLSRGRRPRRDDGRAAPTLSGRRNTHQDGDRKTDHQDGQSRQGPGGLHQVRRRDQRG